MKFPRLQGLVAAVFTPFHPDGSLNLDTVERQAAALAKNQVRGAFVCGTTGESMSLTVQERMRLAERWVAVAPKELRVIVHVGHNAQGDCMALARHAQEIGASAIGQLAPSFFKPARVEELLAFCAPVAGAAPDLPYYYYHIPPFTGLTFACADVLRAARERIPNLAGAKFTFETLGDFLACLQLDGGRFDMVFGRDEMLLGALAMGGKGAIGSTYNYGAPVFRQIIDAFEKGDLPAARAAQTRANGMIAAMIRNGGLCAAKCIMGLIGLDCGPVRTPLRQLTPDQIDTLKHDLEACGYFEFESKV